MATDSQHGDPQHGDSQSGTPEPGGSRRSRHKSKYLVDFRRTLRFVWPHRRYLFVSFIAAVGVMVFYTSGIGSLAPILNAMMSDHETLADSAYVKFASRRLSFVTDSDVPETTREIRVTRTQSRGSSDKPLADQGVNRNDSIVGVQGQKGNCYELFRLIVNHDDSTIALTIRPWRDENMTQTREIEAELRPNPWYMPHVTAAANFTDFGRTPEGRLKSLALVMALFVTLSALQLISRFWQQYLVELTAARAMMDLRTHGYSHVLQLPMSFFSQRNTGETMNRFATDTAVLLLGIRTLFGKTVREPLKATAVFCTIMFFVGAKLMLVVLVVALPAVYMVRKFGRIIRRAQRRTLGAWDALLDILQERIAGIRVVKGYTMERAERLRFFREHRRLIKNHLRVQRFDVATSPLLEFFATIVIGCFILYGGWLVFDRQFETGDFMVSVVCLVAMFDPIRKLSNVNNRLQQAEAAAARIFEILDEPIEMNIEQTRAAAALPRHTERIEFEDVSFRYPSRPDVTVLDGINLTVNAGETIAIVGPNGSGKTSLCNLLLRFYNPDRGSVLIDGHDIREVKLDSLRKQIGLVTQDTVIFTDTVSANIRYGNKHADAGRIREAACSASADEFIAGLQSRPEASRNGQPPGVGYDAIITSNTLSGGQKQRLAIARALLRDPAILIFDEATSQIDPDSARKIHDAVREARRNRTAFVIAHHDRDMLPEADRVVVMDKGRIAAVGKHDELLKTSALYRNLYETQFVAPET